jgi:tetratricopeptide (TPR) repeat protein
MADLGIVTSNLGLLDEAERWWLAAAEAGDVRKASLLGDLLDALLRTDEAERWYRIAAAEGGYATRALAGFLLRQDRLDEAEPYYRQLAELGDETAMRSLAEVLARRHAHEEAGQWLRRAEKARRPGAPPHEVALVVATAVVSTTVAPFVKAIVTKAGEDSYAAVRAAVRRLFGFGRPAKVRWIGGRRGEKTGRAGELLIVEDPGTALKMALHLGTDTPDGAIGALADLDLDAVSGDAKRRKVQEVRVVWDEVSRRWQVLDGAPGARRPAPGAPAPPKRPPA